MSLQIVASIFLSLMHYARLILQSLLLFPPRQGNAYFSIAVKLLSKHPIKFAFRLAQDRDFREIIILTESSGACKTIVDDSLLEEVQLI